MDLDKDIKDKIYPTVYVDCSSVEPFEMEGYICDHSFDEEGQKYYFYTEKETDTEIILDDDFLYHDVGDDFLLIEGKLDALPESEYLIYIENAIEHPLTKYRALHQFYYNDWSKTKQEIKAIEKQSSLVPSVQINKSKVVPGLFSELVNPTNIYQISKGLDYDRSRWMNKSQHFAISGNTWGLNHTLKGISSEEKQKIKKLKEANPFFSSDIQEVKKNALSIFEQVLGAEKCSSIVSSSLTSTDPSYGRPFQWHISFPYVSSKPNILYDLKLCVGRAGEWELPIKLRTTIEYQLPKVKIPSSFKTKESIVIFLTNIVSHHLHLIYNKNEYQKVIQQIGNNSSVSVSPSNWWVIFIKPDVDLLNVFNS